MQLPVGRFSWRTASAVAPFLLVFSAYSQTSTAPATAPGGGSAPEVSLDLVAHDKKGASIRDLKPTDFEITSGGSPLRIDDLHLVTGGPGPGHSHLVTLVFAHDVPGYAHKARDVAAELLKTAPTTGILFAVLRVDGRLRLLQEFTADREALTKAVDLATVNYKRDFDQPEKQLAAELKAPAGNQDQALEKVLLAMLLDSQDIVKDPHTPPAIASLIAACRQQAGLPGRKTLVYFSAGLDWTTQDPEMPAKVAETAIRSRVSIYSIDAEVLDPHSFNSANAGLSVTRAQALGGINTASGGTAAGGVATAVTEQIGRIQTGDEDATATRLTVVCHATGGEHAGDSGNTQKSVQRIVDDILSNYTAYFIPSMTQGEKFRPIRIKTLRAGITVQARGGYFPVHSRAPLAFPASGDRMLGALAGPELPSELQFRSSVLRFGSAPTGGVNSVAFEVPLSQVEMRPDPDGKVWAAKVSVLAQVRDQTGAIVERFTDDVSKQGPLDAQEQARLGAVSFRRHFMTAPGEYVLETVAMDANSGKIGAQRTKFEIPAAAAGPALGDLVLVRQIEAAAGAEDASEPLRCAEGKVVPNLSARLARATNPAIQLFFDVFPDNGSTDKPALKLEVRREGGLLGSVPLTLRRESASGPIRELAKVGTKSLSPGAYEMTVVLTQGAQTVQRTTSVTLE
ncbi:MAG: VWA domain-containing protein [Bryobacteraceae bacterium]